MPPKTDRGKWNKAWNPRDGRRSHKKAMEDLYNGEENTFLDSSWDED